MNKLPRRLETYSGMLRCVAAITTPQRNATHPVWTYLKLQYLRLPDDERSGLLRCNAAIIRHNLVVGGGGQVST